MRGEGTSIVGDKVLEWNKHDCFAVPNWAWHEHINRSKSEAAILFSVNDIPIVEAFNLYREEPENSSHYDPGAAKCAAEGIINEPFQRSNRSSSFQSSNGSQRWNG